MGIKNFINIKRVKMSYFMIVSDRIKSPIAWIYFFQYKILQENA